MPIVQAWTAIPKKYMYIQYVSNNGVMVCRNIMHIRANQCRKYVFKYTVLSGMMGIENAGEGQWCMQLYSMLEVMLYTNAWLLVLSVVVLFQ